MSVLDRYIVRQFLFNFVLLFIVISGLYFLLDLIVNFDEFVQIAERQEDADWVEKMRITMSRTFNFYWPQVFLLYVYMVGLLPLGAAGFTLATLIRSRELVAMLAGGVSMYRIVLPIVLVTIGANILLLGNQELILPHLAARVTEGHSRLKQGPGHGIDIHLTPDSHGTLFTAASYNPDVETMYEVTILMRPEIQKGARIYDRHDKWINAAEAKWNANAGRWDLTDATLIQQTPEDNSLSGSFSTTNAQALPWIISDLDPTTILLRERERYRQFLSLEQLTELESKERLVDTRDLIRIRHSRFSLLIVNVLILVMGMPYFMLRSPGPLLLPTVRAAILCVPAWAGGFVMHQISPGVISPAAVAWLPVALYMPIAVYMLERVET